MLAGERIPINTGTFSNDMTTFQCRDDVLTLLVHLGYLGYHWPDKTVFIPNKEIAQEYINAISMMDWHEVIDSIKIEEGKIVGFAAEFHAKGKNGNFTSAYTQLLELLSRSLFEPENGWRRDKNYIEALQQLRSVPGTEFRSFDSNWNGGMISCRRTLTDASYDYWHDEIIADSDETEGAYDLTYRASLKKES